MGISELQTFLYVLASRIAHPPDRSHRCPRLRQGSRGLYVRAEHASLPPHASDMLAVRIQVIDGERTFTPPDSQPYRLLRTPAASIQVRSLKPVVSTTSVSPSQCPIDSPFQRSSANLEKPRPSVKIWRKVCEPPS